MLNCNDAVPAALFNADSVLILQEASCVIGREKNDNAYVGRCGQGCPRSQFCKDDIELRLDYLPEFFSC